jgi:hypothetical protein
VLYHSREKTEQGVLHIKLAGLVVQHVATVHHIMTKRLRDDLELIYQEQAELSGLVQVLAREAEHMLELARSAADDQVMEHLGVHKLAL